MCCCCVPVQDPDSWDGQKLLRRGAAHLGQWVTCLRRMRLSTTDNANRQALLCATAQGGLLLLSPFWDEAMFKRMTSLYVSRVQCCGIGIGGEYDVACPGGGRGTMTVGRGNG